MKITRKNLFDAADVFEDSWFFPTSLRELLELWS